MNAKGFTLIELLVVISIIALLSSVVLSSLNSARAKGRDAQRALSVRQLKAALELYYSTNGIYPSLGTDGQGYAIAGLSAALVPGYIAKIPSDPTVGAWQYVRAPVNDPNGYGYGLYIYREATSAYCGTGNGFNPGWWAINSNMCPF
ncbi:MAG TPA: prepilin-type N-terminal cleavage/methylation domain-containing protein [Candidatus Paceibacterota bacterium]